jgi:putative membrane protein
MLWVKTFHIVFVASWFAGLFYLPRIYVNLAQTDDPKVYDTLVGMSRRLFRFMTILAVPAVALGLWLYLYYGIGYGATQGWMHLKLLLVVVILGYHHACSIYLKRFEAKQNRRSHVYFRWFNEVPVLLLIAITALVIIKPFILI